MDHTLSPMQILDSHEERLIREKLTVAVMQVYQMVISVNLSQNTYNFLWCKEITDHFSDSGEYDRLHERGCGFLLPEFREEYRSKFSRHSLLKSFSKDGAKLYMEHQQRGVEGEVHWTTTHVMYVENPYNDDVMMVLLSSIIDNQKEIEAQLQNSLRITYSGLPGGIAKILMDEHFTVLDANDTFYRMYNINADADREGCIQCIHEVDRRRVEEYIRDSVGKQEPLMLENRIRLKDGSLLWVSVGGNMMEERDGIPVYAIVVMDITKRKLLQLQLEEAQNRYRMAIENVTNVFLKYDTQNNCFVRHLEKPEDKMRVVIVFDFDLQQDYVAFSKPFLQQFNGKRVYRNARMVLNNTKFVYQEDKVVLRQMLAKCEEENVSIKGEIRLRTVSGEYEWFEVHVNSLWDEANSRCMNIYGKLININELRTEAQQWKVKANCDDLTGMYNRYALQQSVCNIMETYEDERGIMLFIDLDNFKSINDSLGHAAGDEVLKLLARRISQCFRQSDIVARYGGDEFVVYMRNVKTYDVAEQKLNQLVSCIKEPYEYHGKIYNTSGSVGAAMYPRDAATFQDLLERADKALYYAKSKGKNQFAYYSDII